MKENFTLENLFKKKINAKEFDYSEKLWQKLDEQLVPVRASYHKKEKKRILLILSLIFITGLTVALLLQTTGSGKNKQEIIAEKNTIITKEENNNLNKESQISKAEASLQQNEASLPQKETKETNTTIDLTGKNTNTIASTGSSKPNYDNNNPTPVSPQFSAGKHSNNPEFVAKKRNKQTTKNKIKYKKTKQAVAAPEPEEAVGEIMLKEAIEKKADSPATIEDKKTNDATPIINKNSTTVQKTNPKKQTTHINLSIGTNLSSSLKNPGYFAGIIFEKKIDDKQLFFGLKLAHNSLNHQLISSTKAGVFPQITDAVIDRMTTIQIPFGYSFQLNKKAGDKSALLNLGFEPTLLTGLRTIYYDDNGVPNGPRTPVVNSPLLKNAVNKFNLSFIAGVNFRLTNTIGGTLNGGYGLINITDKQYYNRNSKNNNLKYMQAGLTFRLK